MRFFYKWRTRLRNLLRLGKQRDELALEIEQHIEMSIADLVSRGVDPQEARKEVMREFGNVEHLKEECQDSWGLRVLFNLIRNFKFGMRLSSRYKSSTILAIIVLGLGIGISDVVYTGANKLVSFVLNGGASLNEQHVFIEWETGKRKGGKINSLDFKVFRETVESIEELVGFQSTRAWIHLPGEREAKRNHSGILATSNIFNSLDIKPQRGRVFSRQNVDTEENREIVRVSTYWKMFKIKELHYFFSGAMAICWIALILACSSTFNIVIARTAGRSHELAVRSSLGAKRGHLIWQVIVDGLTLAVGGSLLGLLFAWISLRFVSGALQSIPGLDPFYDLHLPPSVVIFSAGVAVLAGIMASIIPAWRASKIDTFGILKDDSKSSSSVYIGWLSKFVVISQVAFSGLVLFAGLVLLIYLPTTWSKSWDLPYDKESILLTRVSLSQAKQFQDRNPQELIEFYAKTKQLLEGTPGVGAVAFTTASEVLRGEGTHFSLESRDGAETPVHAVLSRVTPDYLNVFGADALSGRMLSGFDRRGTQPVCVVDQRFVDTYCANIDPIGMRIRITDPKKVNGKWVRRKANEWIEIVGVIPNLSPMGLGSSKQNPDILLPYAQKPDWRIGILLSAKNAENAQFRQAIRLAINKLAADANHSEPQSLQELFDINHRLAKKALIAGGSIGVALLAMSFIGLYSIISFTASQRRKEFGIRMAIGASNRDIAKTIAKPWIITVGSGLLLGYLLLLCTYTFLVKTNQAEASVEIFVWFSQWVGRPYLWVVSLIGLCSLVSMGIPAWRATRSDPMNTIREE